MVKKLLFASVSIVMMTACSTDEAFDAPATPNEIVFDVTPGNNSVSMHRSADSGINRFIVSARHNGSPFIHEDIIVGSRGNWIDRDGVRLWPADGDVDFFAYKYDETANNEYPPIFDMDKKQARLRMFNVAADAERQTELLYADAADRTAADGNVALEFKHALSEIVFNAKKSSGRLHVEISSVTINHVCMQGDFIYPGDGKPARWDVSDTAPRAASAKFPAKTIGSGMECIGEETTMHLIPQTCDAGTAGKHYTDGVTIVFRCAVWQLADPSKGVQESDLMLIGSRNADGSYSHGELRMPLNINWHPGCRYIYSVIFGAGGISGIPMAGGTMLPVAFSAQSEPID